jgi:hypothetical protein
LGQSLAGFGSMVTSSGHKSWIIQFRTRRKTHRITLNAQFIILEEARAKAHETLARSQEENTRQQHLRMMSPRSRQSLHVAHRAGNGALKAQGTRQRPQADR